ncbi:phosphotransferase family protein [Nitratireductor alexandrii]|uniref:phosphotransferase family protein n=1 Tax=Nitratireductor alexandrii TaxID=2448161 RepID=UPI000FD73CBE|nr:phosphotransferase family protein [Nitratireductor alexandrii]
MTDSLSQALIDAVPRLWGGAEYDGGLVKLAGGASQECWRFAANRGGDSVSLVLRRVPALSRKKQGLKPRIDLPTEAVAMSAAAAAGAPLPRVHWNTGAEDPLGASLCMDWLDGETVGHRILRDPALADIRPDLPRQCGTALARIHAASVEKLGALPTIDAAARLEVLSRLHHGHPGHRPVFDLALTWLERNLPDPGQVRLVHGDFRTGNLMVGPDGLRAILDWELAHLGDPMEDLGWFCVGSWRFGQIDKPAGGFGSREDLFAAYEAAGGQAVDPERVRFWEVMGTLRWGLDCVEFAEEFRRGDRTVERAAIGRRTSETEIDLLRLILPRARK